MCHIVMSHNENDPAPIKNCDQCEYMGTFTNLMYHKKNTHRESNYKCSLCNEEASNKSILNCHMKTSHTDLAPSAIKIYWVWK